jgi:hypothetical protein
MAALQALPFAIFIPGVDRHMLPACHFPLKSEEVNQLQAARLGHPYGIALRVFIY